MAAMGVGTCRIHNLLVSEDTQTMITALKQLGVDIEWRGNELVVEGKGGAFCVDNSDGCVEIDVKNSGTCARCHFVGYLFYLFNILNLLLAIYLCILLAINYLII